MKRAERQPICIWCEKPFDPEETPYVNGHEECGDAYEVKCNQQDFKELMTRLPPGTTFGPC